jgi:hypothetical protein
MFGGGQLPPPTDVRWGKPPPDIGPPEGGSCQLRCPQGFLSDENNELSIAVAKDIPLVSQAATTLPSVLDTADEKELTGPAGQLRHC